MLAARSGFVLKNFGALEGFDRLSEHDICAEQESTVTVCFDPCFNLSGSERAGKAGWQSGHGREVSVCLERW